MKQVATLVASLFAIVLCGIAYFFFAPDVIRYRSEIRRGDHLVSEIEAFRRAKGQLPESFSDLRIERRGPAVLLQALWQDALHRLVRHDAR